ncbi:unnamed protein product [Closterium sp. NIES-53]
MDVWGPAHVSGQDCERYFLLVVDDYTRYTTVFPLRSKGEVPDVLIPWIRGVCLQLREQFRDDLLVLRLHSDRGGQFFSDLLREFCRGEGIFQTFMLPASPQLNEIVEHRIGLVMEVARTSMIHAAAPHFLWPFAVRYAAHQFDLWPRVSLPETLPTLRWTGKVGNASVFPVWGSFLRPTSRHVLPSQDVTFDESVPFYRLFPYCIAPLPPLLLFLAPGPPQVDPLPPQGLAPSDSGAARDAASGDAASGGAEPASAEPAGLEPEGAEPGGAKSEGAESGGAEPGVAEPGGTEFEGAELGGAEPRVLEVLELLPGLEASEVLELLVLEVLVLKVLELPGLVVLEALELETLELETLALEVLELEELELAAPALEALELEALELETLELEALALAALEMEELELETLTVEALELEVLALGVLELAVLVLEALCSGDCFLFRRHRRLCRHLTWSFARIPTACSFLSMGVVVGPVLAWVEPTSGSGVRSAADLQ